MKQEISPEKYFWEKVTETYYRIYHSSGEHIADCSNAEKAHFLVTAANRTEPPPAPDWKEFSIELALRLLQPFKENPFTDLETLSKRIEKELNKTIFRIYKDDGLMVEPPPVSDAVPFADRLLKIIDENKQAMISGKEKNMDVDEIFDSSNPYDIAIETYDFMAEMINKEKNV